MTLIQGGRQLLGFATGNVKASLASEDDYFGLPLTFSLNPSTVSMIKKNETESKKSVVPNGANDAIKGSSNIRLTLNGAHLTGVGTTSRAIDQLLTWATPVECAAGANFSDDAAQWASNKILGSTPLRTTANTVVKAARMAETAAQELTGARLSSTRLSSSITKVMTGATPARPAGRRLPILRFMWGFGAPLHNATVNLESVTIHYERFDFSGTPVWAKVDMTLVEVIIPQPGTNPTSGGVPGRTRHVLTQGENIIQIANRAYGSPNSWRRVAEANGIDDPLRVRPGRTLALPPADETAAAVTA